MPSSFRLTLCIVAGILLVAACGSDPSGSGNSGYGEHSLGWGREIADGVRDSEYPGAELFYIVCADLNSEGLPEEGIPWFFYYADSASSDSNNVLAVSVEYYTGSPTSFWQSDVTVPLTGLPEYNDAGPWVTAARDSLDSGYSGWNEYTLNVQGNDYPEFPMALNLALIQYMSPDSTEQLTVIVDADENTVLDVIEYKKGSGR